MYKHDVIRKTGTHRIATPPTEQGLATDMARPNVYKNSVKIEHVVLQICSRTDRQTDRHDRQVIHGSPARGRVIRYTAMQSTIN